MIDPTTTIPFPKTAFAQAVITWQKDHGRHHLVWQKEISPYTTWLSEIMCQQTQVAQVTPYYQRFIASFPDVFALAQAPQAAILEHWSGLGYYARARNLHRTSQIIAEDYQGVFPNTVTALEALPGIGRSTAGAIVSLAFNLPAPILDGNVKRVLARILNLKIWPGETQTLKKLWQLADQLAQNDAPFHFTQGMMDLGATLCTPKHPNCTACPVAKHCEAHHAGHPHPCPAPKPKRPQPLKTEYWLMLVHKNQLATIQQASPGLWGGLWCVPRHADLDTLLSPLLTANPHLCAQDLQTLPKFRHTFTHFKLDIHPRLLWCTDTPIMLPPKWHWQPTGLPIPFGHPRALEKCLHLIEQTAAPTTTTLID